MAVNKDMGVLLRITVILREVRVNLAYYSWILRRLKVMSSAAAKTNQQRCTCILPSGQCEGRGRSKYVTFKQQILKIKTAHPR